MKSKAQLRKTALAERQELSSTQFELRNSSLCRQLEEFINSNDFRLIHFFLPIQKNNEPDLTAVFPTLWKSGKKIMVSKSNFKTKTMVHHWLTPETVLVQNKLGIPEPIDSEIADINDAELILVPMLLGDKIGHRLGYGGGFYDRLLADFNGQTLGVSLVPLIDKLPAEEWDVPLNSILIPR